MLPRLDLRTSLQVTRNHGLLTSLPRWAVFICHLKKPSPRQLEHQSRTGGPAAPPGAPRTRLWQKVLWDRPRHSAETVRASLPCPLSLMLTPFFQWCPPCRALLPELRKASTLLYGQLKVGTLDCTVHEGLCSMVRCSVLTQPCYGRNSEQFQQSSHCSWTVNTSVDGWLCATLFTTLSQKILPKFPFSLINM